MFGEVSHPSAFDSSQRFLTYWDNNQVGERVGEGVE
jgi:hypothetical protein